MVFEKIKTIIEENSTVEDIHITPETRLKDLSIDSLEEVDLLIRIEKEFHIKIDLRRKFITVADIVTFIESGQYE